jgi:hypothetical protein
MGISLNGLTPAGTYPGLIKTGDNTAISGTPKVLSDGNGNNLPMEVSTTGVNFTNQLQQGGVAVPTASQVAAKQDTLVSGTNIKTINGASLLGSGNIPVVTSPSGVSGAIQFSNGSAFASDAANLFWDDTNNRLGVGTNAPASQLEIKGNDDASFQISGGIAGRRALFSYFNAPSVFEFDVSNILRIKNGSTYSLYTDTTGSVGIGTLSPSARTHIKGSGSTSATTSLLVQNSAGNSALQVQDNLNTTLFGTLQFGNGNTYINNQSSSIVFAAVNSATADLHMIPGRQMNINNTGSYTAQSSALLQVDSTTKGVLFPRMTTILRDAISSPANGLVLYNTTTNKLQCYNGSTWNDLF